MSDVNAFVDAVGSDVTTVAVARIDTLADGVRDRILNEYGPRVSAFFGALVKELIDEQGANAQAFVTSLVAELCQRYHPEIVGEVHARFTQGGLDLTGHGVKLDVKHRDGSAVVASLDIPIAIRIKVDDLAVMLRDATIKLDVVR
jgi:hypothetical protein